MEEKKQETMENAEETVDIEETVETVEGEVETEEDSQDIQEEAEATEEEKPKKSFFGKKDKKDKKDEQIEALTDQVKRQMAEFDNFKQTPKIVIIDEAVKLAAKYSTDNSPDFVNGILATYTTKE